MGLLLIVGGCNSSASKTGDNSKSTQETSRGDIPLSLEDATEQLRLVHSYENGEEADEMAILETIGGGVAVADFDCDGFDDLYFTSGGHLNDKLVTGLGGALWRNRGGQELHDITAVARASCSDIYTHGATAGDVNNDGFADLLVTGYFGLALFINQGDGTLIESSAQAAMSDPKWGTSSAMGDFNHDGNLDIYITHYVDWSFSNHPPCKSSGAPDICSPGIFTGISDVIFMSNGNGTFAKKSSEIGLVPEGKGLGVMVADFTQDSQDDIYVANDTTNNLFYENKGGTFEEIGLANGTAVDDMGTPQGSMGLCTLDFDQDLLPDIMVSNYENQSFGLYKNDGDANFRYVTSTAGLMALGTTYVAWGSSATDFDLDGDQDVMIANGHVMRGNPPGQLPLFLNNLGNGKFQSRNFPEGSYFQKKWRGRGVAAFDLEQDGDMDLVVTHINQNAVILNNTTATTGSWWVVRLVGTKSNRDAIGSRLRIESDKRTILRSVVGGGSYLSQNPYYLHWGLPADEVLKQVEILWPSGVKQVVTDLKPNSRREFLEPS